MDKSQIMGKGILPLLFVAGLSAASSAQAVLVELPVSPSLTITVDDVVANLEPLDCWGEKTFTCIGEDTVNGVDILWEVSSNPDPFVATSFTFSNWDDFSHVITTRFTAPAWGDYASPDVALDTGIWNVSSLTLPEQAAGAINIQTFGYVDDNPSPLMSITDDFEGNPFSVCNSVTPPADPSCGNVIGLSSSTSFPVTIYSSLTLEQSFELTGLSQAQVGGYSGEDYDGGAYFAITPVPLPGAIWLLGSGATLLGLAGRRRSDH